MDTTKEAYEKILNSLLSIKTNLNNIFPSSPPPEMNYSEYDLLVFDLKTGMLERVKGLARNLLVMMEVENKKHPDYNALMTKTYGFIHSIEGDWV